MCGIAGIWSKTDKVVSKQRLNTLTESMSHRGPDAKGAWSNKKLGLVNTRLKILDLSDSGNQPFTDGKDVLVFNGRIFNHLKLKKTLSKKTNSNRFFPP